MPELEATRWQRHPQPAPHSRSPRTGRDRARRAPEHRAGVAPATHRAAAVASTTTWSTAAASITSARRADGLHPVRRQPRGVVGTCPTTRTGRGAHLADRLEKYAGVPARLLRRAAARRVGRSSSPKTSSRSAPWMSGTIVHEVMDRLATEFAGSLPGYGEPWTAAAARADARDRRRGHGRLRAPRPHRPPPAVGARARAAAGDLEFILDDDDASGATRDARVVASELTFGMDGTRPGAGRRRRRCGRDARQRRPGRRDPRRHARRHRLQDRQRDEVQGHHGRPAGGAARSSSSRCTRTRRAPRSATTTHRGGVLVRRAQETVASASRSRSTTELEARYSARARHPRRAASATASSSPARPQATTSPGCSASTATPTASATDTCATRASARSTDAALADLFALLDPSVLTCAARRRMPSDPRRRCRPAPRSAPRPARTCSSTPAPARARPPRSSTGSSHRCSATACRCRDRRRDLHREGRSRAARPAARRVRGAASRGRQIVATARAPRPRSTTSTAPRSARCTRSRSASSPRTRSRRACRRWSRCSTRSARRSRSRSAGR